MHPTCTQLSAASRDNRPFDAIEHEHLSDALAWVASGAERRSTGRDAWSLKQRSILFVTLTRIGIMTKVGHCRAAAGTPLPWSPIAWHPDRSWRSTPAPRDGPSRRGNRCNDVSD